jgi:AraC-like DNA-binding protein
MQRDELLLAFDVFLRGGTCALALLLTPLLLRGAGRALAAQLGALFTFGVAAFAVCSTAALAGAIRWWLLPLQALAFGNNVVFFLFASALFDDDFRLRPWHLLLWAAVTVAGIGCVLASALPPHAGLGTAVRPLLDVSALVFAALAAIRALSAWSDDLVEGRRRFRLFVVLACALYIMLTAVADVLGAGVARSAEGSLLAAIGLVIIMGGVAAALLQIDPAQALFRSAAGSAVARKPSAASADPGESVAIAAVDRAMRVERMYRRDGLTIAQLAAHVGMPEHRLRRLINQRLGHRNFNAFLNGWRLDDVKAALRDPAQAAVPILTIALDAGFSSLGPFNRAFRAETGMTPTEYRRAGASAGVAAFADSEIGEPIAISTSSFPTSR